MNDRNPSNEASLDDNETIDVSQSSKQHARNDDGISRRSRHERTAPEPEERTASHSNRRHRADRAIPQSSGISKNVPTERDIDIEPTDVQYPINRSGTRVYWMNGEALSRPLKMPRKYKNISIFLVIAAILIGVLFLAYFFDVVYNQPIREQQEMQQRLEQDIPLDLPDMVALLPMDNATILSTLQSSGNNIFVRSDGSDGTPLEAIKLPDDLSVTDAAAMYVTGINKLSGPDAAKLLNGSWVLDVDRSKGMNMSIHYADFSSKTVSSAIQRALEAEKLNESQLAESGEDESGNTFASGNVESGGATYAWRISALPLSEIYSISGLPEDAVYVGIRITS